MCGIVGAIAGRDVSQILLECLKHLEYRGYDSAGLAVVEPQAAEVTRLRSAGKVKYLAGALQQRPIPGGLGIAHTRWATHGKPTEKNAHPHCCHQGKMAVVHNGIIENYHPLRERLQQAGYAFHTDTDTEVIVHLLDFYKRQQNHFLDVIYRTCGDLLGAYALGIVNVEHPDTLYAVRYGSPLVIGVGIEEHFIASDPLALMPVTQQFMDLEEGDVVAISRHQISVYDHQQQPVKRQLHCLEADSERHAKGHYRHYMQKEIFEQQQAITDTLSAYVYDDVVRLEDVGLNAIDIFKEMAGIQICACGTSYHAAMVASEWFESMLGLPCRVEIASEFRYRNPVVAPKTLLIALSQSGETADTLAALRVAKQRGFYATLAVSNVARSALMREADLGLLTYAGHEVGVAATKTFTATLTALLLLTLGLKQVRTGADISEHLVTLNHLPVLMHEVLELNEPIQHIAQDFLHQQHALFLGRGIYYPLALEGALKLKEISYVHAEAYPAGELKHGPLALVDSHMPVIVLAPHNALIDKLVSNIQEVQARQGKVYVVSDAVSLWESQATVLKMPVLDEWIAPIVYTVPLQLLAYHIAVLKGTDVDQPRNLAKSVTVE